MVDVITSLEFNVPINDLASYAGDPSNAPKWYVNIDSAEWQTEPLVEVGSRIAFRARFMGKDLAYTYEISEYEPGKKLVMSTKEGPFPMETTYTWEAIDENTTKMYLRNWGGPKGFGKLFAPFMKFMMKRATTKDLVELKGILEK